MPNETTGVNPQRRLARVLATLISAVLLASGVFSIASHTYAGHTSRLGGAEVVLTGPAAMLGGLMLVCLGLAPLALWARNGKQAGWWVSGCMAGFVLALLGSIYA